MGRIRALVKGRKPSAVYRIKKARCSRNRVEKFFLRALRHRVDLNITFFREIERAHAVHQYNGDGQSRIRKYMRYRGSRSCGGGAYENPAGGEMPKRFPRFFRQRSVRGKKSARQDPICTVFSYHAFPSRPSSSRNRANSSEVLRAYFSKRSRVKNAEPASPSAEALSRA